jgi:Ferritin-like
MELMKAATRDVAWLQSALQSVIELELSTLPPYLCGYWCLKASNSYLATQTNNIFFQEMLHFGLSCNLLSATGKHPEVLAGYGRIKYLVLFRVEWCGRAMGSSFRAIRTFRFS